MESKKTKIIAVWVKTNYIVTDFEKPSNIKIIRYVRKEIIGKDGNKNLLTLAVTKDGLVATSFWRPIKSKSGQKILRDYLKTNPKKVHFLNPELKQKYLHESFSKSIVMFLEAYI